MKRFLVISLSVLFALAGCRNTLKIINHPRPELISDFSAFETAGCPEDQYGNRLCQPGTPLGILGCDSIQNPSSLFGGLEPTYPLAICYVEPLRNIEETEPEFPEDGTYFYSEGGFFPRYIRYVIYRNGNFELIRNEAEFKAVYGPVDSADEALGFALAIRNVSAYYDLQPNLDYEYDVRKIEDTHVKITERGYQVQVYFYQLFDCGPHYTYDVDLLVTQQGDVEELGYEPIFRDPEEDYLCVD